MKHIPCAYTVWTSEKNIVFTVLSNRFTFAASQRRQRRGLCGMISDRVDVCVRAFAQSATKSTPRTHTHTPRQRAFIGDVRASIYNQTHKHTHTHTVPLFDTNATSSVVLVLVVTLNTIDAKEMQHHRTTVCSWPFYAVFVSVYA